MIDADELREIRAELSVFDRAAKWELASKIVELDDGILEKAVQCLNLPSPNRNAGSDLQNIPVKQKLELNDLHEATLDIITASACYSPCVKKFIAVRCRTIGSSADALKTYFFDLYQNLRMEGFLGDELFDAMLIYIRHKVRDVQLQAAATAILVHLFLMCDVFEKTEGERRGVTLI